MTCWINRDLADKLNAALGIEDMEDSLDEIGRILDATVVIDAVDDEAEAALDEVEDLAVSFASDGDVSQTNGPTVTDVRRAASTIRARLRAARASHTPEEIEDAWRAWEFVFDSDAGETWDGPMDTADAIARVLPPRPEPAAKPESIIAEASGTHVLERTSRKGHPFVGRCSGCGVEGPASLAREKCPAAKPKETQEETP